MKEGRKGGTATCHTGEIENSLVWLELWVESKGVEMRQAVTLIILGPMSQGRKVDFILNVGVSPRKAFWLYIKLY